MRALQGATGQWCKLFPFLWHILQEIAHEKKKMWGLKKKKKSLLTGSTADYVGNWDNTELCKAAVYAVPIWICWHIVRNAPYSSRCWTLLSNRLVSPEYIILINYSGSPLNLNDLQRSVQKSRSRDVLYGASLSGFRNRKPDNALNMKTERGFLKWVWVLYFLSDDSEQFYCFARKKKKRSRARARTVAWLLINIHAVVFDL